MLSSRWDTLEKSVGYYSLHTNKHATSCGHITDGETIFMVERNAQEIFILN